MFLRMAEVLLPALLLLWPDRSHRPDGSHGTERNYRGDRGYRPNGSHGIPGSDRSHRSNGSHRGYRTDRGGLFRKGDYL